MTPTAAPVTVDVVKKCLVPALTLLATGCLAQSNTPIGSDSCPACRGHADAGSGGRPDAGPRDAGPADAGPPDAGLPADAGTFDAGPFDAGPVDGGPLTGEVCPAGAIFFPGKISDLCETVSEGTVVPLDGVQVSTLQPYSATVSRDGGQYVACLPPNQPTTLRYTLPGYETSYGPELLFATPLPTGNIEIQTSMACSAAVQNYSREVPQFDLNLGAVFVAMVSVSTLPPCKDPDAGLAGWSYTATLVDGGVGDGGPWPTAYFDPTWTLQAVSSTFSTGQALVYNIDPSVEYVAIQASNPQLDSQCQPLNSFIGFTGRGYVAPNAFDFYPWIVP